MNQAQRDFVQEISDRYHHQLYTFMLQKLRDATEAREVVQATFVRLLESERIPRAGDIVNARAYVFRIALNIAIDRQRRQTVSNNIFVKLEDVDSAPASEGKSVLNTVIGEERVSTFLAALAELPDRAREAFLMQRFEGASHAEIAEALGVSNSMVKKYLRRVLIHLRKRMDGQ